MAALNLAGLAARARWHLQRLAHRRALGPLVLLASLLALGAALAWQQRVQAQWQRRQQADAAAQAARPAARPAQAERRAALQAFYDSLPPQDEVPSLLQALIDTADDHGLRLLQGSYRLEADAAAPFARYRMVLPLRGEPAQVLQFLQAALLAHPTLAVDSLQFKREADGRLLEARLHGVLYLRAAAPVPAAPPASSARASAAAAQPGAGA